MGDGDYKKRIGFDRIDERIRKFENDQPPKRGIDDREEFGVISDPANRFFYDVKITAPEANFFSFVVTSRGMFSARASG